VNNINLVPEHQVGAGDLRIGVTFVDICTFVFEDWRCQKDQLSIAEVWQTLSC
jgi:hypothetical protein